MFPFNPALFDPGLWPGLDGLAELYRELEQATARGLRDRPFSCPSGCISCCKVPSRQIETSVFELLPLAMDAWQSGKASVLLENLGGDNACCVFLDQGGPGKPAGCTAYAWRPLMCRLFGYSLIQGPRSGPALYACGILKSGTAGMDWSGRPDKKDDPLLPLAHAWRQRLSGLNPRYATHLTGINEAVQEALGIAGLRCRLDAGDQGGIAKTV